MDAAYVATLCNGNGCLPGVAALRKPLDAQGAKYPRIVRVTAGVPDKARQRLIRLGWQLVDLEKVVLLDADLITLQNIDDLFDRRMKK